MTDHKQEALDWLTYSGDQNPEVDGRGMHAVALAQVHATLYLAEQQRIANIIAYWQLHTPRSNQDLWKDGQIEVPTIHTDAEQNVDPIVREALGLA